MSPTCSNSSIGAVSSTCCRCGARGTRIHRSRKAERVQQEPRRGSRNFFEPAEPFERWRRTRVATPLPGGCEDPGAPVGVLSFSGQRRWSRRRRVSRRRGVQESAAMVATSTSVKLGRLHDVLESTGGAVVAFSGGTDSALVAAVAARALGDRALAVTAVSPSLPPGELREARDVAAVVGIRHRAVRTHEVERESYLANGADRCYH